MPVLHRAARPARGRRRACRAAPELRRSRRDGDAIRHFWSSELFYAPTEPGQDPRHAGTLEPSWNLFDLTPEGRVEDWDEQLCYHCDHG